MKTDVRHHSIPIGDAHSGDPIPFGPVDARGEEYTPCASYPRH